MKSVVHLTQKSVVRMRFEWDVLCIARVRLLLYKWYHCIWSAWSWSVKYVVAEYLTLNNMFIWQNKRPLFQFKFDILSCISNWRSPESIYFCAINIVFTIQMTNLFKRLRIQTLIYFGIIYWIHMSHYSILPILYCPFPSLVSNSSPSDSIRTEK